MTNTKTPQPSLFSVMQWLENNHTLHRKVEALYAVDGYQVEITHDDVRIAGPWHGKTLLEAYAKGMAAGVREEDDVAFEARLHDIHDAALVAHAKRINRHVGDVNTATRSNPTWALALVRAGYAAGAQAGIDPNAPAIAERTQVGKMADWWFNDPNLPLGTKLYLAPQQSVIDNALRYEHIRAHSYIEVECDSPRVEGWVPEKLDALVDEARARLANPNGSAAG